MEFMAEGARLLMRVTRTAPLVLKSGEFRVIPVLMALIERLARTHEVHVFAWQQEAVASRWELVGATIHNIGDRWTRPLVRGDPDRASSYAVRSGPCNLLRFL
jgi:hypothetical protein